MSAPFVQTFNGSVEAWSESGQADLTATTYGTNGGGILHGRFARGTRANPLPIKAGDIYAGVGGRAFYANGSAGAWQPSSPTSLHWVASEDHTQGGFGSYFRILTTPKGSKVRQERVIIADNGTLWVHDEHPQHDAKVDAQTKPVSTVRINISSASSSGAAYGATAYGNPDPGFRGFRAEGTPSSPGAVTAGRYLAFLGGHGYTGDGWGSGTHGLISIKAAQNFTNAANGTIATIETTAKNSTQRKVRVTVDEDGIYFHKEGGKVVNLLQSIESLLVLLQQPKS